MRSSRKLDHLRVHRAFRLHHPLSVLNPNPNVIMSATNPRANEPELHSSVRAAISQRHSKKARYSSLE